MSDTLRDGYHGGDLETDLVAIMLHDLRGPVINAKAFCNEIHEAEGRFREIVDDPGRVVSVEQRIELSNIMREDFTPCLIHLGTSLQQIEERLQKFSEMQASNE